MGSKAASRGKPLTGFVHGTSVPNGEMTNGRDTTVFVALTGGGSPGCCLPNRELDERHLPSATPELHTGRWCRRPNASVCLAALTS